MFEILVIIWILGGVFYCCKLIEDITESNYLFTIGYLIFSIIFLPFMLFVLAFIGIMFLIVNFSESKIFDKIRKILSKKII